MHQRVTVMATDANDDLQATVMTANSAHTGQRRWWLDLAGGQIVIHARDVDQLEQLATDILAQCTLWRTSIAQAAQ